MLRALDIEVFFIYDTVKVFFKSISTYRLAIVDYGLATLITKRKRSILYKEIKRLVPFH